MTMGASHKGGNRDTSMMALTAQHGPTILRHLGDSVAPPAAPADGPAACPPSLHKAVRDAAFETGESGRPAAFSIPSLEAIRSDPVYHRLEETILDALEKARSGLRIGRSSDGLQEKIAELVIDDVRNLVIGGMLEDAGPNLLGDDEREQAMYFGAISESVTEHLAANIVGDAEAEPDRARASPELVRAALVYAEPTLLLIVSIVAALLAVAIECARELRAAEKNDPKIVLIHAVAQAVTKIGLPDALRDPPHSGYPKNREQLNLMVEAICREIVQQLSDPQKKIDGQDAGGKRAA